MQSKTNLNAQISLCMTADQYKFRNALKKVNGDEDKEQKLINDITKSIKHRTQRQEKNHCITFDNNLPIAQEKDAISKAIQDHQVVILCGETGSGKTTQLPKICLDLGLGTAGFIGHTQPRRLAARSVASRIADELKVELGKEVGFKVRFSDHVSDDTQIKLMTDGILLAETQQDRFLEKYDTLIIDEAHERSLNIDFLLGYIKRILPRRPDLKVIITSATIDPERFAKHFDNAPILLVEGRTYPVEVKYRPLNDEALADERSKSVQQGISDCVDEICRDGPGDVLVFLPGERDIRETADYLSKQNHKGIEILPLYGRLSASDQNKIFHPKGGARRVVLATNVAETSITVPGIVYVIDSGLARISRYSYRSKIQRLPIEKISQASANQRKGRCGRVSEGICYRLYDEEDFDLRPEFTEPEILRTNLAEVILQMASLKLGDIYQFPFIEAPDSRFINDGYKLLHELQALDNNRRLTPLGKQMARLPIDPKLSRMLMAGNDLNCLNELLTITAVLSIQDPRERPHDMRGAADEKHQQWNDERSDFMALINLWFHFCEHEKKLSQNQLRKWCRENFLSYLRMREWKDTRRQLVELCKSLKLKFSEQEGTYEEIHKALLSGLLGNIGIKDDKNQYLGPRNRRFMIFPGSGTKKKPQWMMAAEIFETSKVFAHTVAAIEGHWLEKQGQHLLKHTHYEPYFHRKSGHVQAYQKSTLYGLIVNPKKRVNYGKINPVEANHLFIRDALGHMEMNTSAPFMRHNKRLLAEIETLENKARRRDLVMDASARIDFFAERVPSDITDAPSFDKWRKRAEKDNAYLLFLNREDCITQNDFDLSKHAYPDTLRFDSLTLPLSYHFQNGDEADGVTLHIPIAALNQVPAGQCEWLVPGLLESKLTQLIKCLPKSVRTWFVPAPDYAKKAHAHLQTLPNDTSLLSALAQWLSQEAGKKVSASDFDTTLLEPHYHMRFVVADENQNVIGMGRDLTALQDELASTAQEHYYNANFHDIEKDNIKKWSFGVLPKEVEFEQNGITLKGYPALVDMDDSVSIRLIETKDEQQSYHREGLRKLFQLNLKEQIKYLRRNVPDIQTLALWYAPIGNKDELIDDIINAVTERVFMSHQTLPNDHQAFELAVAEGKSELVNEAAALSDLLVDIFGLMHEIRKKITDAQLPLNWVEAAQDVEDQLEWLIYPGFLSETPKQWLAQYPRYMKAISFRLEKLNQAPDKDRKLRGDICPLWEQYKTLWDQLPHPQGHETRWQIEELRVSMYAQQLGTKLKVSSDRVQNALNTLTASLA